MLREFGYAPLILFGIAAFIPDMIQNGIGILGPNIENSFHLSDAGLGALAFVAAVAQIAWGLPQAVAADRGSRKVVAAICLVVFAIVMPFMALIEQRLAVRLPVPDRGHRLRHVRHCSQLLSGGRISRPTPARGCSRGGA